MCITKEPPKKGLAGLETKKTGIFKDSPEGSEMPEKKSLEELEAKKTDIVKDPLKGFEMPKKKNPKQPKGLVIAEKMGEVLGRRLFDVFVCSDPPAQFIRSDRRKK